MKGMENRDPEHGSLEEEGSFLEELVGITGYDREKYRQIKAGWDSVAKPLDGMGAFEELLSKIGAIQGTVHPQTDGCRVIVCCADNGIVEEGVSQSGQEVTAVCAENIAGGKSSVAIMAAQAGADVLTVDIGMNTMRSIPGVLPRKIRRGTRNFRWEPAMTARETDRAIQTGMELVRASREAGYCLLGTGEMGIGNTTTSSAVTAALLGLEAKEVTGRGAGLNDEKLLHKMKIIQEALDQYELYEKTPLEVLECVGGYDIACLVGICMGAGKYHVPVVLDGFISLTAALVACRMVPILQEYLIPSHSGREPAVQRIERELGLAPILHAGMALGEGTGAVLMMQLLKTTNAVYERSVSFQDAGLDPYKR